MNDKDFNGHTPDEDGPTLLEVQLQLAELRGFVRAMGLVADQHLKRLDALAEKRPA